MTKKLTSKNKYTKMQQEYYNKAASTGDGVTVDNVVGSFNQHNNWWDYNLLFYRLPFNFKEKIVLDFGCGPGRNLVKYQNKFARIDGVDISKNNIKNAKTYLKKEGVTNSKLYVCNGVDLQDIPDESYDIVMSTVALQHICVWDIRFNYFKEFYRILKPKGVIAIQMGFGSPSPSTVYYHENYYDAPGTNRSFDCEIASPKQIQNDIHAAGFNWFNYLIGPTGPGDVHPYWIYFNAQKQHKNG